MLASGDKGAIEEEVLRFCRGGGLVRVHSNDGRRKGRQNMKGRSQKNERERQGAREEKREKRRRG